MPNIHAIKPNFIDHDVMIETNHESRFLFLIAANLNKTFQIYLLDKHEECLKLLHSIPVLGNFCNGFHIDKFCNTLSQLRVFLKFDDKLSFIANFSYNNVNDDFKIKIIKLDGIMIKNVLDFHDNILITDDRVFNFGMCLTLFFL